MPVIQPITSASSGSVGTVSSVGLTMPTAFSVANSPITSSGTLVVTALGNATQYIRGDGILATLPSGSTGGGASVSYYLNGSINQGTLGGVTYYEMNRTPILGAGTDFTRNSNGYIASFLTDANDPALLSIPAGNFNFETYFEASSGGGTPSFYVELYKYDGTTFTLLASNSGSPKVINDGTSIEAYFSALAVPQTTLTLTDRLAIRIYVTTVGRTITLHTENNTLCQVITTFTTGLTALNGLTSQVQFFATGTSGTDFNISSVSSTHTFNIPTASATNRGLLSSTDWLTFSSKQPAITLTTTGNSGAATFNGITGALNIPEYTLIGLGGFANPMTTAGDIIIGRTSGEAERFAGNFTTTRKYFSQIGNGTIVTSSSWEEITPSGIGAVPTSRTLTINGTTLDLTADRSWSVGTVTSVAVSVPTGLSVSGSPITSSGTIAISLTSGYSIPLNASQIEWDIAYTNRITSLTTTGNSGAATLISNTLNIPEYTLAGLGGFVNPMTTTGDIIIARSTGEAFRFGGNTTTTRKFFSQIGNGTAVTSSSWYEITSTDVGAVPTTRTITINDVVFDLSANREWSVGDYGTW